MDNMLGLGIILSLQDRASAGLEAIKGRLTALRDVSQDMMKKFDAGAKQLIGGIASMAAGAKMFGVLNNMFGVSVNIAADFEQAMARVGAVSGAIGEDFEKLSRQARDLGRDTQYSATQAANSQELLARAGFQTNEIIAAMPGLLDMASAEGMDLANAADIASSALRGFGLGAEEMNRVADVLAKTSSASNTSISLLGESLKYVAKPASALGFTIEQTNAMLGAMANSGIKGSQAGTALKAAFLRLSQEPTRVAKALKALGVSSKDAEGNLRPIPDLMTDLAAKMTGMGKAQKLGYLANIFGAEAASGMLAVMEAVADGSLPELEKALYSCSGAAKEMSERMNATAQGAMKRLESASEGLRIAIGNHLLPVYTWIINKMAEFKSWLTQLIEAHPILTKAVIGFTTALLGLSGAALIVVGALMSISGLIKMWPLLKIMAVSALSNIRMQARMALASFSKLTIPIVGLVALAGILFYAWRKNLWGIRDMVTAVSEGFKMALSASTDGIAEVDEELANKLKAAGIWDFAVTMGKVFFRVRQFWNGLVEGFKEGLNFLKGGIDWLKGIFAPVIESGQELLKFLGILKPVAKTQAETWKAWGQLIGRIAPIVLTVIAAFKGISIVVGIVKAVTGAFALLNAMILANPILAIVAVCVAAGIYLYSHWEEISEWFANFWENMGEYAQAAADWVKEKWQAVADWWDSWTIADVFAPVIDFAKRVRDYVIQKFEELKAWWDSWKFTDVFAPVIAFAQNAADYVKQKWQSVSNWWNSWSFADIFAPMKDHAREAQAYILQKWDSLKSWWDTLSLSNVFSSVKGYASEAWGYVSQKWQDFASWWDSWSLKDIFPENFSISWGDITSGLESAKDILSSGWQSLTNSLSFEGLPNVWEGLTSSFESAKGLLLSGWNNLAGMLKIDFSGFWDSLSSGFSSVCDSLKGAWNGVTGFIKDTWSTASDYVSGAWDWTKGLFGFGKDAETVNQEQLQAQVQDITVLNRMSEGFSQRVAEMTAAWQPFKASLGEGFEQIYTVMQGIATRISSTVIPAVNSLISALGGVARELAAVSQAGNLDVKVGTVNQPASGFFSAQPQRASGGRNKSNVPAYAAGGIITQPHLGLVGEAGREAIVPLEDRSSGIPLLMSAISELGVSNDDVMPYLNAVAPETASPNVNISAPAQPAPASVNISPLVSSAPVSVQPPNVFNAPLDLSDFGNAIDSLADNLNNKETGIKLVAPQSQAPSSPLLIQHAQNQAVMNGQAQVNAQEQSPDRPVSVNNHVEVTIEGKPVELYIDGEKVGSAVLKWTERQSARNGVSEF